MAIWYIVYNGFYITIPLSNHLKDADVLGCALLSSLEGCGTNLYWETVRYICSIFAEISKMIKIICGHLWWKDREDSRQRNR